MQLRLWLRLFYMEAPWEIGGAVSLLNMCIILLSVEVYRILELFSSVFIIA